MGSVKESVARVVTRNIGAIDVTTIKEEIVEKVKDDAIEKLADKVSDLVDDAADDILESIKGPTITLNWRK